MGDVTVTVIAGVTEMYVMVMVTALFATPGHLEKPHATTTLCWESGTRWLCAFALPLLQRFCKLSRFPHALVCTS